MLNVSPFKKPTSIIEIQFRRQKEKRKKGKRKMSGNDTFKHLPPEEYNYLRALTQNIQAVLESQ